MQWPRRWSAVTYTQSARLCQCPAGTEPGVISTGQRAVMLCDWGVKADMVLFAGNTVWSISERVRGVCVDALYKSTFTYLLCYLPQKLIRVCGLSVCLSICIYVYILLFPSAIEVNKCSDPVAGLQWPTHNLPGCASVQLALSQAWPAPKSHVDIVDVCKKKPTYL